MNTTRKNAALAAKAAARIALLWGLCAAIGITAGATALWVWDTENKTLPLTLGAALIAGVIAQMIHDHRADRAAQAEDNR